MNRWNIRMSSFKIWLASIVCALTWSSSIGQDSQFSQFYANPLYLNPALTGSHSGTYRVMTNYRDQWSGPLERPFSTIAIGGDVKYHLKNAGSYSAGSDIVAVGLQFLSDRVGLLDYNTTQLSLFGAFHKLLEKQSNQYLSVGLQFGIAQRGINYNNLDFQDEFDGVNQFNLPTQEILPANSQVAPDVSVGLHYSITPAKNNSYFFGVAYQHWNRPNISFFDRDIRTTDDYEAVKIDAKLTAHIGTAFPLGDFAAIEPRAIYISQGISQSGILGTNLRYELSETDGIDTHLGFWLRSSRSLSTWQPTDAIVSVGLGKGGLLVGLSYDMNLRNLSGQALGTSTFELSVSYIGNHDNDNRFCPVF